MPFFNRTICLLIALGIVSGIINSEPANTFIPLNTPVAFSEPIIKSKKPIQRIAERDPVVTSDTPSCVIPFSRAGNLIVIRARVDTAWGNFILDTGAPGLVLNMTYFRNYASDGNMEGESGGITGTASSDQVMIPNFSFGPIKYFDVTADRVNLGHIENSKGIRIHGLLGLQLFRRFEMIIDYEKSVIHLHLISKKEASFYKSDMLLDPSTYDEFSISTLDNKLITYGQVAGKKLAFLIDTGAESNVLDSRLPDKIFEQVTISSRILLSGSGTKKVEALYGNIKNVKMGNIEIQGLPILVTNLEKMCYAYDKCLDGMLGFDFLSLHKIGFNFVRGKMYIWK